MGVGGDVGGVVWSLVDAATGSGIGVVTSGVVDGDVLEGGCVVGDMNLSGDGVVSVIGDAVVSICPGPGDSRAGELRGGSGGMVVTGVAAIGSSGVTGSPGLVGSSMVMDPVGSALDSSDAGVDVDLSVGLVEGSLRRRRSSSPTSRL